MKRLALGPLWAVIFTLGTAGCAAGAAAPTREPSTAPGSSTAVAPSPPAFASPAALPGAGRILFVIEGGGPSQPVYLDPSGLHLIPLADSTFAHPVWASSNSIIFDSQRAVGRHLFRMGLDGSNLVELTSGATFQERTSVSSDGSTIAYDDYIDSSGQDLGLHVALADGTNARALTPGGAPGAKGGDTSAAISPDGKSIVFERAVDFDAGKAGLFIIGIDGTGLRRLTDDASGAGYPRWSPDGKRILFTGHYDGPFAPGPLWVVDAAGGKPVPLTDPADPGWSFEGDWSPDGSQVVFKYYQAGWKYNELRVANADGTHHTTLWAGPDGYTAETPDWAR